VSADRFELALIAHQICSPYRSLPSHDKASYYDSTDSEQETGAHHVTNNRGNKLAPGARNARRGRLADWSASFPSPLETEDRARKRQRIALTPTLSLLPKASNMHPQDLPDEAILPPPPRNPIDIFTTASTIKVFSSKSSNLPALALSAIGLIESDIPCVKALTRVCTVLRGDDYNWDVAAAEELEEVARPQVVEQAQSEASGAATSVSVVQAPSTAGQPIAENIETQPIPAAAQSEVLPTNIAAPAMVSTSTQEPQRNTPVPQIVPLASDSDIPIPSNEVAVEISPVEDIQMADANLMQAIENTSAPLSPVKLEEPPQITIEESLEALPSAQPDPIPTEAEEAAPRSNSTSPDIPMSSFQPAMLDASQYRHLMNPQAHIESLFISPTAIVLPPPAFALAPGLPPPLPSIVPPADQQGLLHASLTELQRFLADSIEYQERLGEIRDGVLAVERRRKGLYAIIKSFVSLSDFCMGLS